MKDQSSTSVLMAIMAEQLKHRQWWRTEHGAADTLLMATADSATAASQLDDKCGSHWLHSPTPGGSGAALARQRYTPTQCPPAAARVCLPSRAHAPPALPLPSSLYSHVRTHCVLAGGGRDGKATSSHYKYRLALQANVWLKLLTALSFVPPCIKTGANFGCSMFASTLSRMIANGRIGKHAEHVRTYHARARPTPPPQARAHVHAAPERRATPLGSLHARARLHHRRVRAHARHLCGTRPPWVGSLHARLAHARALHQYHVRAHVRHLGGAG